MEQGCPQNFEEDCTADVGVIATIVLEPIPLDENYFGKQIDPAEAALAREWNGIASTGEWDNWNYSKYRREMTAYGLSGYRWHVGHIYPNESGTDRTNDPEDMGWNLMALEASDNRKISDSVVTDEQLRFWNRAPGNY